MAEALPPSPAALSRPATKKVLPQGAPVSRIYFAGGAHPTEWNQFRHYGPTRSRFDHHLFDQNETAFAQERGIMYLCAGAEQFPAALAEVFQNGRLIDRNLNEPTYAGFELAADLALLDLTGTYATAIGATMAIHSGLRATARGWSRLFYDAYPDIHGLLYCSSTHSHQPLIALYERGRLALPQNPIVHRALSDKMLQHTLITTAESIGYGVV